MNPEWFKVLKDEEDEFSLSKIRKDPDLYLLKKNLRDVGCIVLRYNDSKISALVYKYNPKLVEKSYKRRKERDLVIDHNFSVEPIIGIGDILKEVLKEKINDIDLSCTFCGASNCQLINDYTGVESECGYPNGIPKFRNHAEQIIRSVI